jgi:hypothetical protein
LPTLATDTVGLVGLAASTADFASPVRCTGTMGVSLG